MASLPNGVTYKVEMALSAVLATYTDVTAFVLSASTQRGRSRQLDAFTAGKATIVLNNSARTFDPTNTAGAYYPYVLPRRNVRITIGGTVVYTGTIDNFSIDYNPGLTGISTMTVTCSDMFSVLAGLRIGTHTPAQELTGTRIYNILVRSEINLPAADYTDPNGTGFTTLGAYSVADQTNLLDYLQAVTLAEQGYLFVSGAGKLTFKDRGSVLNSTGGATFSDVGGGNVPYQDYGVEYGTDFLYNYIVGQRSGGSNQVVSDATSITAFRQSTLSLLGLLTSDDTQVSDMVTYMLSKFKDPAVRIDRIKTVMQSNAALYTSLLALEVGSTVSIIKTFSTGTPTTVTKTMSIEGISHTVTPDKHDIVFVLGAVDNRQFFMLDEGAGTTTLATLDDGTGTVGLGVLLY